MNDTGIQFVDYPPCNASEVVYVTFYHENTIVVLLAIIAFFLACIFIDILLRRFLRWA